MCLTLLGPATLTVAKMGPSKGKGPLIAKYAPVGFKKGFGAIGLGRHTKKEYKNNEIEYKNNEIEYKNNEIEYKNNEIEYKNNEIKYKNNEIEYKNNEIKYKNNEIKYKNNEIKYKNNEIKYKNKLKALCLKKNSFNCYEKAVGSQEKNLKLSSKVNSAKKFEMKKGEKVSNKKMLKGMK
ncbi:mitochondrial ribosomal protein L41, putative [Plasmodium malariae]|uniref:Mitochondrial ribosomal protein L41, putative n=1 Tax=Plasmodium malariae TaxID=5858 RepID=A0A1C3L035_PLAMA|nr:mitochondrial ribosomal protein L41, putative [Plasmodium malariae]